MRESTIRRWRLPVAYGCTGHPGYWPVGLGALFLVRARFVLGERRVRDSNPRGLSPALAVFKTAAIGH